MKLLMCGSTIKTCAVIGVLCDGGAGSAGTISPMRESVIWVNQPELSEVGSCRLLIPTAGDSELWASREYDQSDHYGKGLTSKLSSKGNSNIFEEFNVSSYVTKRSE